MLYIMVKVLLVLTTQVHNSQDPNPKVKGDKRPLSEVEIDQNMLRSEADRRPQEIRPFQSPCTLTFRPFYFVENPGEENGVLWYSSKYFDTLVSQLLGIRFPGSMKGSVWMSCGDLVPNVWQTHQQTSNAFYKADKTLPLNWWFRSKLFTLRLKSRGRRQLQWQCRGSAV